MNVTSSDGFIDTEGDIYINKEVAQKVRNVNVAAHELLHGILNNNIKEPGQLKRLVTEFKAILPRETADLIQKRIDDNYRFTTDEQGNRVERPESEYMEEYFTAFADLIGNRKVKFNENIFTKIGEKITPIFKGKGYGHIKFETGKDVYDFIKSYQKQIAKGELKPETIEVAKKIAEQDVKMSKTEDNKKIKEIFDEFTGPAENRKFKSKEEFKKSPEFFDALLEIEQSNTLDASIRNTVSESYLDMNPGFVKEVKERISDKYRSEYDASKNSLFGWLTGKNVSGQPLINRASGDIQIKRGKKPSTVSADKKIGGEDNKTTVAETLVSDDISPEDYADMKLAQDKLKKIKPQQSKIAKKIDLTDNEINLAKRDIISFLRKTDRPAMTDPKKFFKALVDYTTGRGVQPGGFAKVIYDKLSLPKDGKLSTKNKETFIREIAEDLIALNKVDPAVMRRSRWTPFYELEIKKMSPTQTQKAIDEGRIPSTTNLKAGNDLFKVLDPTIDEVVEYLNDIRPDVLKRKMPKFLAEVIIKNEFNEIVDNPKQPIYDAKGNETDNTIDLSESITEEEVVRGAPQVREKIARPQGIKFSLTTKKDLKWKTDEAGNMTASFNINNKKYNIELYPVDDEGDYRLNFNLETKDGTTEEITGTGDSFKVISVVYNGVVDEIESNPDIKSFQFESDKSEPTRVRLYTTLMNKFADKLGWESDIYESTRYDGTGSFDFELVKPKTLKSVKLNKAIKLTPKDIQKLIELSSLRSINDATKKLNIKGKVTVSDATRPTIQGKILKAIVDGKLGLVAFESMMPASAGAKSNRRKNGDKYYKLSNGEEILGQRVLDKNNKQVKDKKGKKRFKPPTIEQIAKKYGEGVTLVPDGGRIYYGVTDPAYVKARQAAIKNDSENNYQRIPVGKKPIDKVWLDKKNRKGLTPREQEELNFKAFKQAMLEIEKAVQEGSMDIETAALMIAQGYQATAGIIKGVAGFKYRSRNMEFAKTRKQATGKVPFREEHNPPASVIGANLIWAIKNGKVKALMPFIKKNYYQTQLSLADDLLLDLARLDATLVEGTSILDNPIIRLAVAGINLNSIINIETGKSIIDEFGLGVSRSFENFPGVIDFQNNLVKRVILEGLDVKQAKKELDQYLKIAPQQQKANKFSKSILNNSKVLNVEGNLNMQDLLSKAAGIDQALKIARDPNAPIKKIRVFDFDDTLAKSKSKIFYTKINGTEGELTAEEFAEKGADLVAEGAVMDFTDFNIVREGKRGPMFDIAKKIEAARGLEDVFVLTARAPESQQAIYEFLKSEGLEIPLKNIVGLGNSTGEAKANWMVDKAAEGYNDFYFADDAYQNVKAVKDAMSVIDVKSKVQQAKFSKSKNISSDFNKLIEESTGIGAEKVFSDVKAQVRGAKAKRQRFFIPPSAEDMLGLVYTTLGKGKKGEAHLKFYQENLFDPYTKAMENLSTDRVNLMSDFKALKKELDVPKDLAKKTESGFTNEQAVRVHLWNKMGEKIPGLSKTDLKELNDIVENNPKLKVFADQILSITKGDGYSKPKESWAVGTITTDLIDVLNTKKRGKYLETWKQNKDLIYSKENLNKLEAAYGPKYRAAIENSLRRMESGSNRLGGGNQLSNKVLDYINNSTGAIMFFNTRSAILQTLSAANFVNWSFNNPFKAGKAFANQPQYWKDFVELMNSDYLKDRRNGLKLNINESEIANAAKTSGNKAKAALNYILEKGYAPTKFADSFAIASGGATFYRNRINDLIKNEGKTEAEAKEIAMKEFRQVSEISQQSSDPSKISQQQASDLGRVVLQFANTPMQYARIQKRAVQDIINKRGDLKTNISKIAYYGFLQNMIFNGLQQGLFALGFGDDEIDEKEEGKLIKAANGMLDSSLRGLGMAGVTVQVLKNLGIDIYDRSKRDRPEYSDSYKKLLEFSPAVKSKLGKFQSAAYPFDSKTRRAEVFEKGFSLDNPAYESMAKVVTGTTNLPLDRMYSKVNNLSAAMDQETETWQSVAMVLGWPEWQIKGKKSNKDEKRVVSKEQAKKDLEKKLGVKFL
jgi:hypothetical protein